MTKLCLTKLGRRCGWSPVLEAEHMASLYLGDANEAEERGNRELAERNFTKCQFWLDRYNRLAGNS